MHLRQGADAILVGVNTVINDDPSLTVRAAKANSKPGGRTARRIILDSRARTPLKARVVSDKFRSLTTIVVSKRAPAARTRALERKVTVLVAEQAEADGIDLHWLLKELGREEVTNLLVEGGGKVNASFLLGELAHRIAFFFAPKVLGDRRAIKAVAGEGVASSEEVLQIREVEYRRLGPDMFMTGLMARPNAGAGHLS
jgi:diaminohydroxyphosphoribosylaminopyrimidine deaminase/5-amino-6-(5-phosphoribosylamino)uracil reductase